MNLPPLSIPLTITYEYFCPNKFASPATKMYHFNYFVINFLKFIKNIISSNI